MNQGPQSSRSIAGLLHSLREETTTLLQQEVKLATAEISERAAEFGKNALRVAIGGFVLYAGAIVFLFSLGDLVSTGLLQAGLSENIARWLGRALIGGIVALIGWLMVARAMKALSAENIVPDESVRSLKKDKQWAEDKLQHSHESTT
jgi:CHASE3 domain sensor protein